MSNAKFKFMWWPMKDSKKAIRWCVLNDINPKNITTLHHPRTKRLGLAVLLNK